MHSHDHDTHDHAHHHAVSETADGRRRVAIAAALTFTFMLAEVIGGLISGSLALLADAAHMLTDAGALALAWVGFKLAERPADESRSYGWARFKVLAAFVNGLALIVLAIWICIEAVQRLLDPRIIIGDLFLVVAVLGLVINLITFSVLHGGNREDLNMRAALWHVAGDLLGSVAAIAAAIIVLTTGWTPIDPILSMAVAAIILVGGYRIIRTSGHILIEGVPRGLSTRDIREDLEQHLSNASSVEHIHVWALNEAKALVTLEVHAKPGACTESLRLAAKARLLDRFQVEHATIEVLSEPEPVICSA